MISSVKLGALPSMTSSRTNTFWGRFRKRKIKHAKDQLISKKESQSLLLRATDAICRAYGKDGS
ncbi:MAG: hypothetical protein KA131_09200, partial [Thauera sp.]|nr:hypothetical protein [Thauera sp.]